MGRLIFFVILTLSYNLFAQDAASILSNISTNDQQMLTDLFHVLMDEDQFSYTLFGDKPVSLSGDYTVTPYEVTLSGIPSGGIFWKRWAIWKKIKEHLSIKKYLFIEEPAYNDPNSAMGFLFFINKPAFIKTVNQHIQTFRNVLGSEITAIGLLNTIEHQQKFMASLKNSELLLGILLGYGERNAQLYARRFHLSKYISGKTFSILPPLPGYGFSSIEEEEQFLDQKLQPFFFQNYGAPWMISPVQFAADLDHKETKKLQKKYARQRAEISRLYNNNNNFLELITSQLVSN